MSMFTHTGPPLLGRLFFALTLAVTSAHAADVSIQPAAGSGFVVKSGAGESLRVQSNGTVALPTVPGNAAQPSALCISAAGLLGPCTGGGVGGTTYSAGSGLGLNGTVFSVTPSYQLPQSCTTDQIAKWNGSGWVCATPASVGGLPACLMGEILRFGASGIECSALPNTVTDVDSAFSLVNGDNASIVVGVDGLPVISYFDRTTEDLKVMKCGNVACSTGNTFTTVDSAGRVGSHNSIAIGADGLPVISYYDESNGDLKVAKCGNTACSAGNTLTTVDSSGFVGSYSSIAVGADGLPVISYYLISSIHLKMAKCGNAACSAGNTLTTVDGTFDVGRYSSIAVGADGLPVISYYDLGNGGLKVVKCGNAACSASNTLTTVDTIGDVGLYTSIAIGPDGLPVISFFDTTYDDLKVAKCGNAACSSGNTINTVDNAGSVGQYTSIAIGSDGLPVISYYDGTNGDLKVAKCGNASCSAGNTLTAVDSGGAVGIAGSIAVGNDGLPVISYYDLTNQRLKVAKCSTASCRNP